MKTKALFLVLALVFLEWLDFSLYLYLAKSVFAKDFFPPSSAGLFLSFALFTAAYFARPLGGWFFGRRADLSGRRKPMFFSAALMGAATLGLCFVPSYASWGIGATWALLLLRMAQGFALGGEINTSAMFLVEHHPNKPLVAGAYVAAGGAFGMFVGAALAALLQSTDLSWSWRPVFAVVGLVSLWVCRLRNQLTESPEFKPLADDERLDWLAQWRGLANIALVAVFVSVMVYLCNAFWVSFAIDQQLGSKSQCAWAGSLAQLASSLLALLIARYAKPTQVNSLLQASMLLILVAAPLLFYFTLQHVYFAVLLSLASYALANALLSAALYYFLYLQLPVAYRCRGVSTVWALAASIGTLSLPFAEQAVSVGIYWLPGLIVSSIAFLNLVLLRLIGGFCRPRVYLQTPEEFNFNPNSFI